MKFAFRFLLAAGATVGLALGAITLIGGPQTTGILLGQTTGSIEDAVNGLIDDPDALRYQLAELREEYPDRIDEVRAQVQDIEREMATLQNEVQTAAVASELARADLGVLGDYADPSIQLTSLATHVDYNGVQLAASRARQHATHLTSTVATFDATVQDGAQTLDLLGVQHERLQAVLDKLLAEQAQLDGTIADLDNKISMIERNDELIELLEDRAKTINELERFEVYDLAQLQGKLDAELAEQEQELLMVGTQTGATSYVDQARQLIQQRQRGGNGFESASLAPVHQLGNE